MYSIRKRFINHLQTLTIMRLSRNVYDERLNNIIRSFTRLTQRMGVAPQDVPVHQLVRAYGFSYGFTKTDVLRKALLSMHNWREAYRQQHDDFSPSKEALLSYVKNLMKWEESWKKSSAMPSVHLQRISSFWSTSWVTSKGVLLAFLLTRCTILILMNLSGKNNMEASLKAALDVVYHHILDLTVSNDWFAHFLLDTPMGALFCEDNRKDLSKDLILLMAVQIIAKENDLPYWMKIDDIVDRLKPVVLDYLKENNI